MDLDANNSSGASGNNYNGAYTENTPAAIADVADATITAGAGALTGMTVSLNNRPDGALESLSFTQGSTPITGSYNSGTGILTLSGNATAAQYQEVLRSVRYDNTSDNPNTTARGLTVTLTDQYGQTATATSSLSVTRVNDAPTITSNGGGNSATIYVNETRTVVTTVTATDPDSGSLTYSISGGADAARFSIDSSTGVLTFNVAPDHEAPTDAGGNNVYDVIVRVNDGGLTDTQTLAVSVVDMPSTLVVTTTADTNDTGLGSSFTAEQLNAVGGGSDGHVSLREAMIAANTTAGRDTITFNIATGGVDAYGAYVITTVSSLPTISEAVVIDAATQPGTGAAGHPLIVLDGNGAVAYGLQLSGTSDGSTIRGLVIRDFTSYGIYLPAGSDSQTIVGNYIGAFNADGSGAGAGEANGSAGVYSLGANLVLGGISAADRNVISGNGASYNVYLGAGSNNAVVQGNYLGTNAAGTAVLAGNGSYGLLVESASTNVTIGGTAAGAGNVISGFTSRGAWITTTGTVIIQGNYVGTNASGTAALGNVVGLYIDDGGDVVVGGSAAGARNLISGNTSHGIHVAGSGAVSIQGNYIGVAANGSSLLGNGGAGVYIAASNVTVGGKNAGEGNLIAGNTGAGIAVASGHHNFFYRNSIHSNGGLGIDLGNDGVTTNDYNDGDGGGNYANNFPVITSVVTVGATTYITGSIEGHTDVQPVYIEFFSSPTADGSGHGEGRTYLGAVQVSTNADGDATFSLAVTGASVGDWITAVANIEGGLAGASEFSLAVQAVSLANAPRGKAIWNLNDRFFQYTADWNGTSFNPTGVTGVDLDDDLTMLAAAEAPTRQEIIVIGSADVSGRILAVIWDGSTWSSVLSIPIASPSATASSYFSFGVAYEQVSGDAMLVWDNGNTTGLGLSYATWDGSSWSAVNTIAMPVTGEPVQLRLASQPGSDQMVLVGQTTAASNNQFAMVWNGSSWGNAVTLGTNSSQQYFETQVAYEAQTGRAMVLYDASASNSSNVQYRLWDGVSWSSEQTVTAPVGITAASELYATAIASDAGSNRIALAAKNANEEVWLAVWDGSVWGHTVAATTVGVELTEDHPTMALAFETQSGELLAAYGKSTGPNVYYRTWSSGGGWSAELTGPSMGGTDVPYVVKLYADPHSNGIMMGVQDGAQDLHYVLWNGSSWGAVQTMETTTGETYRENFTYVWYENAEPVINNLAGDSVVHTVGQGAVVIDQGATASVTDPDATGYEGGNLTVSIVSGSVPAQDVLGIRDQGNGAGQIGVSGANVSHGGVVIGTVTGGTSGSSLVITLKALADDAAVTALVANITYNNLSGTPTVGARTVRYTVTDGMGVSSTPADTTVYAALENTAPTITSSSTAGVAENSTAVMTVTASDSDVPAQTLTYSIVGGVDAARFTINASTGALAFVSAPNYESPDDNGADGVYNVTVQVSDGSLSHTQAIAVTVTDVDEFDVGAVTDSNAAANQVAENAANGSTVGLTASASDADGSNNTISYTLSNNAGGRFAIHASTGVVTVANGSLLDYEAATSHNITVLATSADGSTRSQSFTINLTDVDEFDVGAVTDSNAATNEVTENASNGDTVGLTALASDVDATNSSITYSLSNDAGGRFTIHASTGVVTVANASLLDYETDTSHNITVLATSADGSSSSQGFTIQVLDRSEAGVGAVSDADAAPDRVAENAANGTAVGVTAQALDPDVLDSVSYTLSDDAGGRFAIDSITGVVTVADGSLLNREAASSHQITVLATSTDGSATSRNITISLLDVDEFDVGAVIDADAATNEVAENAVNGSTVGIAAQASDADATTHTVTYSLDDDAGGRFAIDASTGVVTVANGSLLDRESAASHNITVRATSADTSSSTEVFTINLVDVNEFGISAVSDTDASANTVLENAANGSIVGITAQASDADATTNAVAYSLSDDAGGRFTIHASTGVVTVADGSALNREANASHTITVVATSADGSSSSQVFAITVGDVDEFDVSAVTDIDAGANTIAENAANGDVVGITAQASDDDATNSSITYSLSDDANGRFTIHASTGVVTVADASQLDYEAATSHSITVLATSVDGSSNSQSFTINLTDVDEFDVGAVIDTNAALDTIAENAANGDVVGITAQASDADGSDNVITYSLLDDAGGRFAIDASTGVVTVADASLLNAETALSHDITVQASSADGSVSTQVFTILVGDVDEFDVGAIGDVDPSANQVAENATNGSTVGLTAVAVDSDATTSAVTYSLSDDAGGRFTIHASTGVVTVANGSALDREANASHDITVLATSADGSTRSQTYTIALSDVDESDVSAVSDVDASADQVAENAANGTVVGITAQASDADATNSGITYSLSANAGGRFAIDASTGVVTVANGSLLNHEAATSHSVTVVATSADGSSSSQSYTIQVRDVNEFAVSVAADADIAANVVSENAATGSMVGVTAYATDADGSDNTVTYSLSNDAGGRFTIDAVTGVVTVANGSLLDYETSTTHAITVRADSSDGSFSEHGFTIGLADVDEFDISPLADANAEVVAENAANGSLVGLTAQAFDADGSSNAVTYGLSNDAGGRFAIDAGTGVVTVADGSLLDHESATSHDITVVATSADGSTSSRVFAITVGDVDEFDVGVVTDTDAAANTIAENAAIGTGVGITVQATDGDATNSSITYSLSDDANGRFTINASTGVVTVADASQLDYEAATSHSITVQATSVDGSSSSQTFLINVQNLNDNAPVITSQGGGVSGVVTVNENGTVVTTVTAIDADLGDTLSYRIVGGADAARFAIHASTGVLVFLSAPDHEAPADADGDNVYDVHVAVSDVVHLVTQQLAITVADVNEATTLPPGAEVISPTPPSPPSPPTPPTQPSELPRVESPSTSEPSAGNQNEAGAGDGSATAPSLGDELLGASELGADALRVDGRGTAQASASSVNTMAMVAPSEYRLTWQGVTFEPDAWLVSSPVQVLVQTLQATVGTVDGLTSSSAPAPSDLGLGEMSAWPPASGELAVALDVQSVQLGGVALSAGAVWWAVRTSGLLASMAVSAPAWRGIDPLPILSREREDASLDVDGDEVGAQAEALFDGLRRDEVVADIEPV